MFLFANVVNYLLIKGIWIVEQEQEQDYEKQYSAVVKQTTYAAASFCHDGCLLST